MNARESDAAHGESFSRALYDISQLLGSAEDSEERVSRVLEWLHLLVPYQRCAVLHALPDCDPHLVAARGTPPDELSGLMSTTLALLGRLLEAHGQTRGVPTGSGMHLAVPLIGLDEVIGVLFVQGPEGAYDEHHVRSLSVVAAKLAAYFSMLRARSLDAARMRQLAAAHQAAETANRAKDEFLALVSHELRTPLGTILVWADALRSHETREPDRTRAFEAIGRSVSKQTKLIDDLLELSCIAAASLRLDLRAVEPAALIKTAIRALRPQANLKSIRLEVVLDESVTPLLADPNRLHQIVIRLVANAIKFTPEGGTVEVRLERTGALARILVIDTGSGIHAEKLSSLFQRFSQADSSSARPFGGLGVGLALVKDVVELHGGRVRAESPGHEQGSTFIVELPLAIGPGRDTRADAGVSKVVPHEPALAGVRVLVVDDDRDIGEVLQFVLEAQGALVELAVSAAEALALMAYSMPDVLLSDIAMPGENGYDLLRKVIAREGDGAPPAAALSAHAARQDLNRAVASGFRTLLAKPVDPQALVSTIATLVKERGDSARRRAAGRRP